MNNSSTPSSESYSPSSAVDSKQQREKRTHCKTMLSWFSRLLHPNQSKGESSSTKGDEHYASTAGTRSVKPAGDITSGSGSRYVRHACYEPAMVVTCVSKYCSHACTCRADGKVTYGYSLVRGKRFTMEDCVFAKVCVLSEGVQQVTCHVASLPRNKIKRSAFSVSLTVRDAS